MENRPEVSTADVINTLELDTGAGVLEYLGDLTLTEVPVVAGDRNVGPADDDGNGYKGL